MLYNMLNSSFCGKARPLRPRSHRHHGRSAWTRLWLCTSPCSTCCMQGCGRSDMQQTCSPQNTTCDPWPGAPCLFGCWQPMHTQQVTDGMVNSSSAGWVRKLTETRAVTVATHCRGGSRLWHATWPVAQAFTQCKAGHWTRIKQEILHIRLIELLDTACTPLTYKWLYNLLSRSCPMLYNCFWLHGHGGWILII